MSTPPLDGPMTRERVERVRVELTVDTTITRRDYCKECTLFREIIVATGRCKECQENCNEHVGNVRSVRVSGTTMAVGSANPVSIVQPQSGAECDAHNDTGATGI